MEREEKRKIKLQPAAKYLNEKDLL
jgi:hypothetical protein